jgi:type IV secretory pathway TrbD component
VAEPAPEQSSLRAQAPPAASEDIHLPGPTYLPIMVAGGIALALVGVLLNFVAFLLGMVTWIVAVVLWIRSAREEMAALPHEHR